MSLIDVRKLAICAIAFLIFFGALFGLAAPSPEAGTPIRIGYVGGLSGNDVGQSALFSLEAMRTYFASVNAKGGIRGRQIEIVPLDNRGLPQDNYTLFEKAKEMKLVALTGVHFSNDGLILNKLAEENQIPLLIVTASHPDIVSNRKFVARACFSDVNQAADLSRLSLQKLKAKKVILITDVRNSFSLYISSRFKEEVAKTNAKLLKEIKVSKGEVNFTAAVNEVLSGPKPDLILFTTPAKESAIMLTELTSRGLTKTNFVGTDAWESVDILKILRSLGQTVPIYFAGHWIPDLNHPDWRMLAEGIKAKFQTELSPYLCDPVVSWDAAKLLNAALESCPSYSGEAMMKCLKSVETNGLTGHLKIRPDGESHKPVFIFRVRGNKVEHVVL